jgi:hypothetical protein
MESYKPRQDAESGAIPAKVIWNKAPRAERRIAIPPFLKVAPSEKFYTRIRLISVM